MSQMNKLEKMIAPLQANFWEWETNIYISRSGRRYRDVLRFNKRRGRYNRVARCIEEIFSKDLYEAIQRANPIPRPSRRDRDGLWLQTRVEYNGRFVLEINCPVTEEVQTVLKYMFGHKSEEYQQESARDRDIQTDLGEERIRRQRERIPRQIAGLSDYNRLYGRDSAH